MNLRRSSGFTLIEVLIAMLILGSACVALFGLLSSSMVNLRRLEDVHRYQIAAEDVMNRMQSMSTFPPEASFTGRPESLDAQWKVTVTPWFPATLQEKPGQAVMKIDVDVSWQGRSGQRSLRLETVKPGIISYEHYDLQEAFEKAFPR